MRCLKTALIIIFAMMFSPLSFAANDVALDTPSDGTYHSQITKNIQACAKLCNKDEDNVCRGYTFYQSDTRSDKGECRLNNGLGSDSKFQINRPENIDIARVIADMNDYRASYGLLPLRWNEQLGAAADVHSKDLAFHGILQHEGTDGSAHGERVKSKGYDFRLALENVAAGQKNWADALEGWKESPGHNENLLNPDVNEIGVALDFNPKTRFATYWTMVLASPLRAQK